MNETEMTWHEIFREYWLKMIGVVVVIGFLATMTVFAFTDIAKEKKEDKRTTFEASGTVQSFRSVFDESGWLGSVVEKKYVTIDGQEYEVSTSISNYMHKGDKVIISGKRGRIEKLENYTN